MLHRYACGKKELVREEYGFGKGPAYLNFSSGAYVMWKIR
jgi:hypothetical protein